MKKLCFVFLKFVDRTVLAVIRLKTKFEDRSDTIEQIWEPKHVTCKFRDRNDTTLQVW
jgi:hypothetical protein